MKGARAVILAAALIVAMALGSSGIVGEEAGQSEIAGGTPTTHAGETPTAHAGETPTAHAGETPTAHAGETPTTHAGGTLATHAGGTLATHASGTLATPGGNGNGIGKIKLLLNFQDAPLQTVLDYLSETAGLAVVSNVSLDGYMTVISRQAVTVDEAVGLINSVLKEMDLAAVRTGKTLRIVTFQQARQMNIPVTEGSDPQQLGDGDQMLTHVLPLRYVTAAALKQNLLSLLPEYATIEANEDGNTLIITDTAANIKRLMQIVEALDTHMASVAEIRVFRLVNADATSVATLINSMFQQDAQTGRSSRQGGRGNVMEMMMQRGGPGGAGGPFGDMGGTTSTSQSSGGRVQVVAAADSRTNAVVVRGSSEALAIVAGMIATLDDRTTALADVRVFQLRYADALNTAQVINQLFGQSSSSSRNQQDTGPAAFFRMRGGPQMEMQTEQDEGGATLQVVAAADSRTNSVVVTGPAAVLDVVAAMIERLDAQVPNVADVKVFHLKYADAENTASLINEVFGASRTSSSSSRSSSQQNQQVQFGMRGGGFGQQQATQTGGTSASDVEVVASADSRTNSVVVSGPPETLEFIGGVIAELDENPEQERQIFVYALKNGTASNLMTILNNMFEQMQSLNQQGTGRTGGQQFQGAAGAAGGTQSSSANDLSEETYFEADEETNSLLVMTSTKNYEKIKPILDQLDKPVGQVLIKVLFAEITHSNNVDLGTEFSAWNLRGAGPDRNVDISTNFPPDLGSGITASVLDNTLDVTIRALQQTAKLNILSRPYILTSNNQTATMRVVNQVPFATGSTTVAGQSQITTDYQDIGIILSVTPQINPEGLVIMTVSPEISSTTGDSVQVSDELSLPVFATRASETKVAVQNGQTIVIGGLIQDEIRDTVHKVPLLGDVPVLGGLFRRTQKDKAKTELLIFLTPHVASEAELLTMISNEERQRSNLPNDAAIADVFRHHLIGMGSLYNADADIDEPNQP
ncbi:MAG: hypothetical protein JW993_13325 [Sedimentisphaerales bacterium]|nr:hypothetical protein [Sedimentisphaerales bacterium]